jgi:hypothetical protein
MRTAQLAHQNGLAGSGGKEVKERGLGLVPLAGFDLTTIGRFSSDHRGFQIGQQLRLVNRLQPFYCFEFQDHRFFN